MNNKYAVLCTWDYRQKDFEEKCEIRRATLSDEDYDGFNFCGKEDGVSFDIYEDLESAIVNAHFNPEVIKYVDFTEEEKKEVENILKKFVWNDYFGLIEKKENKNETNN